MIRPNKWTNASVLQLAKGADPVATAIQRARDIVIQAIDAGWDGPPFDPLELADHLKLEVFARDDVRDARTVPSGRSELRIEFNPNRPRARVRFSLAHEIAHTLFPDCAAYVRNRGEHLHQTSDEWQLEAICNIAAAEFLMPAFTLPQLREQFLGIDAMITLRHQFDVSAEALLIRIVGITDEPCAMFCASPLNEPPEGQYRIDYTIQSRAWTGPLLRVGTRVPPNSLITQCASIGYTAKGNEGEDVWGTAVHVESEGIPPYPGSESPRVAGILTPVTPNRTTSDQSITYLKGNALEPRGQGEKIIAHVVNDRARLWGGKGFAPQIRSKWPFAQQAFRKWAESSSLKLGSVHWVEVAEDTKVASMVCQHGYGPSPQPRIRYAAIKESLTEVARVASERGSSVHMPRIGSGQAGGRWEIVQDILLSTLCAARVATFVYDLPNYRDELNEQAIGEEPRRERFEPSELNLDDSRFPA